VPNRKRFVLVNGQAPPSPLVRGGNAVVLTVISLLVLIPFVSIVSTSLAPKDQVLGSGGFVLWPSSVDLSAYTAVLSGGVVTRALGISAFVTIVGTLLSLITSSLLAYALSRPGLRGRGPMLTFVLVTLFFAPGIIPSYLAVKQLGLIDNVWSLILPTLVSGFNVIVLRAFFMNLPQELFDSARMDGAGELTIFFRLVLPLSRAVLSVVGLFYAVGYWNAFFNALIYINDASRWPLPMIVRSYVINQAQLGQGDIGSAELSSAPVSVQMAMLVLSILPIVLVYPFLQKNFSKGVLTGAVKG
jgi:putative aldouronate transport system permease protein